MRPQRCAQERGIPDALASRSRVASPQAGPLLRRTRAHLAVVRALPDDERGQFSSILALSGNATLDDELVTQDTRSYLIYRISII